MKLAFRTQLLMPNLIALFSMLIIALVVFININSLLENSAKVEHTFRAIDSGNELLMHMIDQETGMRGFAVTGDDEFLAPYTQGGMNFSKLINDLKDSVSDNPSQVSKLQDIEQQARMWKQNVAEEYIDMRRSIKDGEVARKELFDLIESGVGKRNMDNLRNLIKTSGLSREVQNEIMLGMVNMETGLRGFLLNNDEEYLEPYNEGKMHINRYFNNYVVSQSIQSAAQNWVNDYAEKAISINRKAMDENTMNMLYEKFSKKEGKQYMDKIRRLIATFVDTEETLLKQRNEDKENTAWFTKTMLIVVTIFAMIISLAIVILVTQRITNQLGGEPDEVALISEKVAKGDFTGDFQSAGNRKGIYKSMLNMSDNLKNIVMNIRDASMQIANASEQLNTGSQNISTSANEQASSVEEVSSTIEEMTSSIQQNSENAVQTQKISNQASESIRSVNNQSNQAVEMNKQISEKIQIINEIAFQTNILALNAAVEAARAGEHGKGFAVVAAEVRKLAERSGKAANEIVTFAQKSLEATEKTNKALMEMLPQVESTTQLVQEISAASSEQSNGANQVNSSVQQLNNITQQNASSSEEMASNAEELSAQAQQLNEIISFFQFDDKKMKANFHIKTPTKRKDTSKETQYEEKTDDKTNFSGVELNMTSKSDDSEFEKF